MATAASAGSFPVERLLTLSRIEQNHFWFDGRRRLLARLLARHAARGARRALDVGCGTGSLLGLLSSAAATVVGLDGRQEGLALRRAADAGVPLLCGDATALPFADGAFDLVVALDVLEHVDDGRLMSEAWRVLAPGGVLIVSVPALPWLWSHRDTAAGHLRRYTRPSLIALATATRFSVADVRFFQALLLPLVLVSRIAGRRSASTRDLEDRPGSLANAVLGWITRVELALGRVIRWPAGSSLVAVCHRS